MLSSNELSNIMNLISDESMTFEELISKFNSIFNTANFFKISMTLEILIKDHQLNLFQEISSFYILYYLNKEQIGYSTFPALALHILNETKIKTIKIILISLLQDSLDNIQLKIIDCIKFIEKNKFYQNIDKEIINLKNEGYTHENNNNKNYFAVNPIITEKKLYDYKEINNKNIKDNIFNKKNNLYSEIDYMSYYPYPSKEIIFNDELKWIIPRLKHNFIWENNCFDKIRYLINQILNNGVITKEEINYIISTIKKKPNIIQIINLSPEQMMELIEKDESLSFEILLVICKTSLNE
jgi:hypothetical protein